MTRVALFASLLLLALAAPALAQVARVEGEQPSHTVRTVLPRAQTHGS